MGGLTKNTLELALVQSESGKYKLELESGVIPFKNEEGILTRLFNKPLANYKRLTDHLGESSVRIYYPQDISEEQARDYIKQDIKRSKLLNLSAMGASVPIGFLLATNGPSVATFNESGGYEINWLGAITSLVGWGILALGPFFGYLKSMNTKTFETLIEEGEQVLSVERSIGVGPINFKKNLGMSNITLNLVKGDYRARPRGESKPSEFGGLKDGLTGQLGSLRDRYKQGVSKSREAELDSWGQDLDERGKQLEERAARLMGEDPTRYSAAKKKDSIEEEVLKEIFAKEKEEKERRILEELVEESMR